MNPNLEAYVANLQCESWLVSLHGTTWVNTHLTVLWGIDEGMRGNFTPDPPPPGPQAGISTHSGELWQLWLSGGKQDRTPDLAISDKA